MSHSVQELLTTRESAKHLKLSDSFLRNSRVKGTGPKFIKIGRAVRYRQHDLDKWLDERVRQSTVAF